MTLVALPYAHFATAPVSKVHAMAAKGADPRKMPSRVAAQLCSAADFRCRIGQSGGLQPTDLLDESHDLVDAFPTQEIGEDERPGTANPLGIRSHDGKVGAHMGSEVGLVNDQEIGPGDGGSSLAGDLRRRSLMACSGAAGRMNNN
jgi:hypothetical protein